jgi:hypothetical protein
MQDFKIVQLFRSFIILPMIVSSTSLHPVDLVGKDTEPSKNIIESQSKEPAKPASSASSAAKKEETPEDLLKGFNESEKVLLREQGRIIDEYYRMHRMRLAGFGLKMAVEAKKYNLDWRLMPAISVRESSGGRNKCRSVSFNHFGWNSCKTGFETTDKEIEIIARNLGGANPRTAHFYSGELEKILTTYNGNAVPDYAAEVINIMMEIDDGEVFN